LGWAGNQQISQLEKTLRQSQRAQRPDSTRLVAGRLGEASHSRLPRTIPAGRLSAADIHDAQVLRIVAVSPSSTYRVLKAAGRLDRKFIKPSKKGTGYVQPGKIHQEWHTDISYLNLGGSFYFLISVLDGFSRYLVHWEIREKMTEQDVELVLARAMEKHPGVTPRIISDNGPQFIAKDFKEFIRTYNLTHVRTSPYYPQSNGKLERWHASIKQECIRLTCPATKEEAEKRVTSYVQHYNHVRLHSAIGYITPADCLAGLSQVIGQERDRKLEEARQRRLENRQSKKLVA